MKFIIITLLTILYFYSFYELLTDLYYEGLSKVGKNLILLSFWQFLILILVVYWIYQQMPNMQEVVLSLKYTRNLVRLLESRLSISERSSDQVLRILTEKTK